MGVVLDVDPAVYVSAGRRLGGEVAGCVRLAWVGLSGALDGSFGMAGSDPGGAVWGGGYDRAATAASAVTGDVIEACYRVAALLEQTGGNYAAAETASIPGGGASLRASVRALWADVSVGSLGDVESAVGIGLPAPGGWSTLQHAIGAVWPDGHQDRLHAAAAAWHRAGDQLLTLLPDIDQAVAELREQRGPEVADAVSVVAGLRARVGEVAGSYHALGHACTDYAGHLDAAHHAILAEIRSFLEWTAGIEAAGAGFALLSFGASELAAQAAELAEVNRAAAAITAIIDRLVTLAHTLSTGVAALTTRIGDTATAVQLVLARQLDEARLIGADSGAASIGRGLPGPSAAQAAAANNAATAEASAIARLTDEATVGPASETWADLRLLGDHFTRHGKDFAATSPDDYATQAARFLRRAVREHLPTKVKRSDGSIRIYDPKSNTFGVYTSTGRTRSFFKPSSPTYWVRVKGDLR